MNFPDELKHLRKSLKLGQADLAEILNTRQGTISTWERGICYPSPELLKKLIAVAIEMGLESKFLEERL